MKKYIKTILLVAPFILFSQSKSKEYSKNVALYQAKFYLINEILDEPGEYDQFIIDPLAAAKSSELTSVYYEGKNKRGLVLGFYDDYWDKGGSGRSYQGYAFKNLDFENALHLLNKIESIIKNEKKFLNADDNENNIYFNFDDLVVIIYREGILSGRIRIAWNGFDAEWENTAFRRTKRRFEKSLK